MCARNVIEQTLKAFPDHPPYSWSTYESAPWTSLHKPLANSKLMLISSGGFYISGKQKSFGAEKNDLSFREIPWDIDLSQLSISHNHYDNQYAKRDPNVLFPLDRLRELKMAGIIGDLSKRHYTFMGRIFRRTAFMEHMLPGLLKKVKEEDVDLLFLVPA